MNLYTHYDGDGWFVVDNNGNYVAGPFLTEDSAIMAASEIMDATNEDIASSYRLSQ